jgi:hypothetical protein
MLSCRRLLVVLLLAGLLAGLFGGSAKRADADSGAAFVGGMMAGHVVSRFAAERRAQTEALQSMAHGGGGGFGRPMPYGQPEGSYGRPEPAPAYAPPRRRRS